MTCEEYLRLLSTSQVEEVTKGRAGDHLGTCAECNRMTTIVVERERNMVTALHGAWSQVQPAETARYAMRSSRRGRLRSFYSAGSALLVVMIVATVAITRSGAPPVPTTTEVFGLQCLSSTSALELLRGHLRSKKTMLKAHPDLRAVTITGTQEDMAKARVVLERYDNPAAATCLVVPGTVRAP